MKKEESKKIFICLYIIIGLLLINTFMLASGNGEKEKNTNTPNTNNPGNNNPEYDVSMMNVVNSSADIVALFDEKGTHVVYVGRPTCGACVVFLPTLQQAQEAFGYVTVYLDIEQDTGSSSDREKLVAKLDVPYTMRDETAPFGYFYGYTPKVFIIRDGKMIDGVIGAIDFATFSNFLESNGIKR